MKKIIILVAIIMMSFLVGCKASHIHNFIEGKCECGEVDPNYVPPHVHSFMEGVCECGEVDPNYQKHEHNFVEGVCECGEKDSVKSIEDDIKYILSISDNNEKLIKIMEVEKKIRRLSVKEKESVVNYELYLKEAVLTSLELNRDISWSEFLLYEINYSSLKNFVDANSIKSLAFSDSIYSSMVVFFEERKIINDIMEIINVPYVNSDYFSGNTSWISKGGDLSETYSFTTGMGYDIDYNNIISIRVYVNGNVSITLIKNGVRTEYVSIVKADYEALKELCNNKNL